MWVLYVARSQWLTFLREITRTEERVILVIGMLFWSMGGLVCYAYDSIQIEKANQAPTSEPPKVEEPREWHSAADFLLSGSRRSLLQPKF